MIRYVVPMRANIANVKVGKETVDIEFIKKHIEDHPDWHRTRLSQELCRVWNWSSPTGQLKDMSCRKLLLRLARKNQIVLPKLRRASPNALRNMAIPEVSHPTAPILSEFSALSRVQVIRVIERSCDSKLFNWLLCRYHYLGFRNAAGENIKYVVKTSDGIPLACLLFSSAAWKTAPRDQYIGWNTQQRELNLQLIANNTRFLILPWVRVPNLASHILARVAKRIRADWQEKYGHPLFLLETFVEHDRFLGTCYQAANWYKVGQTTGRTRDDRKHKIKTSLKSVWLYPLTTRFREELQNGY